MPGRIFQFFFRSIRGRLVVGVALLFSILMGLLVLEMVARQKAFMEAQVAEQSQGLATSLAASAPSGLLSDDLSALDEVVDSLQSIPHMKLALILDSKGRVRATTDSALFNLVLDDAHSKALITTGMQLSHDKLLDSIAPVKVGGKIIGYARVMLATTAVQAELAANMRNSVIFIAMAMLAGGLLVWLLIHNMTRKLVHLSRAADAIAAGDLAAPGLDGSGNDEVARLTRDFEQMAQTLAEDRLQRQSYEADLFAAKERAQVTLESIGDAVITTDINGHVEYMNPVAESLTGWSEAEACGKLLADVFFIVDDVTNERAEDPVREVLRQDGARGVSNHTMLMARGGRELVIENSAAPIRDRNGEIVGVVLVFHDNTESHAMAQEISYQASHDALTGLANRHEFERKLRGMIDDAIVEHSEHALLYIDLDQFKVVNDTSGHAAGDELLRQLTLLLRVDLRASDTLARLGGDEFGVLLRNCPLPLATRIANELVDTVKLFHFCWENKVFTVGASIGLVAITDASVDCASLLIHADTACYLAKERGRGRVQAYVADDDEMAQHHAEMHWVGRITQAHEEGRFRLFFQPIIAVAAGPETVRHIEILLRMVDEDGKLVAPGAFIPAAERYNLMATLDRWVVAHTLDWLAARPDTAVICAINLSGQSMGDERMLAFIKASLTKTGVAPCHVCFEITETAAITNLTQAVHFIGELKTLGCRFSLDDFGSGLSSFAYLKNLPVDYLKIDGGFVKDIDHNETSLAMVTAINHIGHTMKIQTIAEFVENPAILDRLREIKVDFAQGYLIAQPMPLESFAPCAG